AASNGGVMDAGDIRRSVQPRRTNMDLAFFTVPTLAGLSKPWTWRDRAGCVPVVLLYTIRRAFSFAAAFGAFVWIAADARHELGEQTGCARFWVPPRGDA